MVHNFPSLVHQLELINFRNHVNLKIKAESKFVLILGENGSGKTNVLEAVSLLSGTKGFRNAKNSEIIFDFNKLNAEWGIKADYLNCESEFSLLIGCKFKNIDSNGNKIIKINNELLDKQTDISNIIKIIWLTPQMENLFLESPSIRRKFLDRMTYNFFSNHISYIQKYEYFTQSRAKVLNDINWDQKWVEQIEMNIAELSLKIINNRIECLKIINAVLESLSIHYLKPKLSTSGEIEDQLKINKSTTVFEYIIKRLAKNRLIDAKSKRCSIGAHKSDINVLDRDKNRDANLCSTGEQKSMIISLILGQSYALYNLQKIAPILVLDEIFAHLDEKRKVDLIDELEKTPSQIWITSTDKNLDILFKDNYTKFILN
jgi:DNA replication and repair protein RecF